MDDINKRDYEKEREELLKLMDKQIPRDIKEAIEITISAQPTAEIPKIKISHKGAYDAD
ncbi:MAG: hypothetical protein J7K51_01510 [Thermotogae bacterium]|nr:hypothetical protein [Thermotogota bacterium]